MPQTVKAKFLLGWMSRHEAMEALNSCVFNQHLSDRKAIALWKHYRDRVANLEPRNPGPLPTLALTETELQAVANHIQNLHAGPNGIYFSEMIKVHPGDLVARQFYVLTEKTAQYEQEMQDEQNRINKCLGVGMSFAGQLVQRLVTPRRIAVDLPHAEFVPIPINVVNHLAPFTFKERDRYVTAVRTNGNRVLLWGGYHRVYALLRHMAGDAAGGAPLLTVMTGIPEVENFLNKPSFLRETVLGGRPALLRDFLDDELFMTVDLRKKRAEGRIEIIRPGKVRAGVYPVDDNA